MNNNCDTANIERIGVSRICTFFEENGWTFRERHVCDFGIDADVEQKIDGVRTNQHIALQIKSGESYVKVKKNGKITFSIDPWHYSYWLQSDRPVLILLYDPETKNIYWEQVRLSIIKQAQKFKKIEIDATKVLNEKCFDELNDIIKTYVKHEEYKIDEEQVSFDFSIACVEEYSSSIKDLVDNFDSFKNKLNSQYDCPQPDRLVLQIDVFAIDVRKHIESDYALLHKACWYLAALAYHIDNELRPQLIDLLNEYINILIIQKASWLTAIDNFKKLYHNNIPKKVQRSNDKLIRYLENYTALIDLSLEDFLACKIINENYINNG